MDVKDFLMRFIKFNIIGTLVFVLATVMYWLTYPTLQIWTWFVANCFGGLLQFSLTMYFNKKRGGKMFDSY